MPLRARLLIALLVRQQIWIDADFVKPPVQNGAAQCFETKPEFDDHWKQLNGVTNGGRCYFFVGANLGWKEAWAACGEYGASLAYIHTSSEYRLISDYSRDIFGTASIDVLLPLMDTKNGGNKCELTDGSTLWYSSETESIPTLPIANGYLYRYHNCEGADDPHKPSRCIGIFRKQNGQQMYIGDWTCNPQQWTALCEFTNFAQNFTKSFGKCLGESPIQTVSSECLNDCAVECSQREWCRSFNFIEMRNASTNNECELFNWSIADTNSTKINGLCSHYNYVE